MIDGWSGSRCRSARRTRGSASATIRRLAFGHRQRAARLGRDRRRAAVRAASRRLQLRRHLLQQRRLSRHVRPRHHRPGRLAGACRATRARQRCASTRRWARSTRELHADGRIDVDNVPSYRKAQGVAVEVPGVGAGARRRRLGRQLVLPGATRRAGELDLRNVEALTDFTWRVRQALNAQGLPDVDHVELFGAVARAPAPTAATSCCVPARPTTARPAAPAPAPSSPAWPPMARSPKARTGSRKASSAARSRASFRWLDRAAGTIAPTISGRAHVTAESTLLLDPADPFCWGIR